MLIFVYLKNVYILFNYNSSADSSERFSRVTRKQLYFFYRVKFLLAFVYLVNQFENYCRH